ncbi:Hsp70 family protein [Streptomyces sp. M41]|uniref:Hsp70 family protein n=1 Tax=Streptomyces sp. M41 TaxID=3059412 RepID=UPI00374DA4F0
MVNSGRDGLVIGLDLGDGETTLAWTTRDGDGAIHVFQRRITGERSVLTAMARAATDRRRLLGEEAVYAAGAAEFSLNFKQGPDPASFETPEAVLFVQALLAEFLSEHKTRTGGTDQGDDQAGTAAEPMMVVGHPAGWDPEVVDAYARHLRLRGVSTRLLPESQAALVHVRRPGAAAGAPSRSMAERPTAGRVLVVDIGSSTTDFTLITDMEPRSLPLGADFGCRLIDFEVAELVTERHRDDETLKAALAADGGREFLLLACRRAKEAQFSGTQAAILNQPVNPRFGPIRDLAWGWLRHSEIPALVSAPGGWADGFRALLKQARRLMEDKDPDQVVLTGGGSRMPLTRRICREVFPEAAIDNDPEPAFSVARGLALAGYTELRLERFRASLTALLEEPEFDELCTEHISKGFAELKGRLAGHVRDAAGITGTAAPGLPLDGGEPPSITALRGALNQRLGERVSSLCRTHGVPHDALDLDFQLPLSVAEALTDQLSRYASRQHSLRSGLRAWAMEASRRTTERWRQRNSFQPTRSGNPYVDVAQTAWAWGAPVVLWAMQERSVSKMVKEIKALSLDEGKVDELVGKIRAHIRDQLLGRLTEIEKLIF